MALDDGSQIEEHRRKSVDLDAAAHRLRRAADPHQHHGHDERAAEPHRRAADGKAGGAHRRRAEGGAENLLAGAEPAEGVVVFEDVEAQRSADEENGRGDEHQLGVEVEDVGALDVRTPGDACPQPPQIFGAYLFEID